MAVQNIVVAGCGGFGSQVASELFQLGHDVLAIDIDQSRIQDLIGRVTYSVAGDATDEILMRELGVANFDVAIVALGRNIQTSIMCAVLLRSFEIPMLVARARTELHAETLQRIGCHRILNAEEDAGTRLAQNLLAPNVEEYINLGATQGFSRMRVPPSMAEKTLRENGFTIATDHSGLTAMALVRDENATFLPDLDEHLLDTDQIVVAGDKELIDQMVTS